MWAGVSTPHTAAQGLTVAARQSSSHHSTADPGQLAVDEARRHAEAFADRYGKRYPAAVACLLDSLPELTRFLRFRREHWQRIRHTNLIERTFGRPAGGARSSAGCPASAPA